VTSAAQSRPARPCIIRLASTEDAPAIARIYRPVVEATAVSFETEPPDANEMHRRVAETLMAYPWLVLECDSEVVGFAYASRHRTRAAYRWSVDTSAYVDERFRRQGIGHGLYVSLFAILSAQGFANAYAGIALPNPASVALHEHVGFKAIGVFQSVGYKLGAWRDVGWWHRPLRSNDRPPPPEIQSLEEVKKNATWPALLTKGSTVVHVAKPLAAEA
jgi:L-amino acid N-acyltransferase YncA